MPNYDYVCSSCGHHEEIYQTYDDLQETCRRQPCPSCGKHMEYRFSAPHIQTPTTFYRGNDGFEDDRTRRIAYAEARAAGINPEGKHYSPQLARRGLRFRDPEAWITSKDDVRRVCQRRGLECDGDVTVKGREPEQGIEDVRYSIAPDIVESHVEDIIEKTGPVSPKAKEKLREDVHNKLMPTGGRPC